MSDEALDFLLSGVKDQRQRKEITTAYYAFANGDAGTFPVQFAILLKSFTASLKLLPAKIQKALANETGSFRDALLAHQARLQKTGSDCSSSEANDRAGKLLQALRELDEHLAAHRKTLETERETILAGITGAHLRLEKLTAHRIIGGLILSYLGGVLSVLAFQDLLPFLLSLFTTMGLRL